MAWLQRGEITRWVCHSEDWTRGLGYLMVSPFFFLSEYSFCHCRPCVFTFHISLFKFFRYRFYCVWFQRKYWKINPFFVKKKKIPILFFIYVFVDLGITSSSFLFLYFFIIFFSQKLLWKDWNFFNNYPFDLKTFMDDCYYAFMLKLEFLC